ncbi:MAG: glycine cleavage system protein GcvH [Acidimicrobiales bacterium]|jgi:glycine cleavage system H protein|nr:glycine cleavage system protein GcvH [Acidimicrobiales bacterium]HLV90584.1 glycine cleavage system protein GcvH [Acidimicrobiia bacterium]
MNIPEDLRYTPEHEWIRDMGDGVFRIGITDYAQDQLGDVVYVELPEEGKMVSSGDLMAEIESTKSVGEVYAPFAGVVTALNEAVVQDPSLVNQSPYDEGWLVDMRIDGDMPDGLLDAAGYRDLTE